MIKIDLWKVSEELSKLQTVSLDNEKWVRLDDVIDVLRRELGNDSIDNGSPADSLSGAGV